ncbi:Endoribonuclease YbeY [Posidoniimonas polymericola]|uniref:Endoribonuclease YbeY n=1 Tax=Posidoniimonas polymericola TaxID=2528002 RepID=A0A5C5XU52_9BACT|nr:rRNA maturation RNase YbeY [Posidoniimonas polymericola]TWT65913.1 Endoribonuclease YbeY [Posidoniimonas polymericola]
MEISVNNSQATLAVDEQRLIDAAAAVLAEAEVADGVLSIAVVDDEQMHKLNREFLDHDYPTDVLSFDLSGGVGPFQGEVIVSSDTAASNAVEYGSPAAQELLLYVIHGTLHLVGYNDKSDDQAAEMRRAEQRWLSRFFPSPTPAPPTGDN